MKHAFLILAVSLTAHGADPLPTKKPAECAKTYYEALNKGVQADIEKLRSAASLASERSLSPDIRQARKAGMAAATKNGTVSKVEVLKQNIQGTRAWVDVRLHYKDGTSQQFNCGFTIEGGAWKATDD
jgi:hypothetical protein